MAIRYQQLKKNKYMNKKTEIDGIVFDSGKEASRYVYLKNLQAKNKIQNLELQPKFELQKGFSYLDQKIRAITYKADFMYSQENKIIVEDVKSPITKKNEVYILKKKMLLKQFLDNNKNIIFQEV
jgi:hypothetical protein